MRQQSEKGASSITIIGLLLALVLLTGALLGIGRVQAARLRAQTAADQASLAAAWASNDPMLPACSRARVIAARHGARLHSCLVDHSARRVRVQVHASAWGIWVVRARAHAQSGATYP